MYLSKYSNQCDDSIDFALQITPQENQEEQFTVHLNLEIQPTKVEILDGKVEFILNSCQLCFELENLVWQEKFETPNNLIEIIDNAFYPQQTGWQITPQFNSQKVAEKIEQIQLGVLRKLDSHYQVKAQIRANKANLTFVNVEGLWPHDISPNKHAILDRKLAQFIEKIYCQPWVGESIFTSNQPEKIINSSSQRTSQNLENEQVSLKQSIAMIYQSPTDDFIELAKIACLNPLTDFGGANLLGVNLSGLSLSGINLAGANLRGADLTDSDLSEASLKSAKLNGADLSGAYLEGANLDNANLQNASLALSNLIGANLSNANLAKTNLQNTSLGQTQLQGTLLSQNVGLDQEQIEDLISKGAILSD